MTVSRARHRGSAILLLFAFALMSAVPAIPWRTMPWIAAVVMMAAILYARNSEIQALGVLGVILLLGSAVSPARAWPFHLLIPLLVFTSIIAASRSLRRAMPPLRWGRVDRGIAGWMAVTVFGSSMALVLWYRLLQPDVSDLRAMIPSVSPWMLPLAGLGFAITNAFLEEIIWRGLLWELLCRVVPTASLVILLQALSFGLIHIHGFPRGWLGVGMATLYGLFLGFIRHRSKGLAAPIITHAFADLTIFGILLMMA